MLYWVLLIVFSIISVSLVRSSIHSLREYEPAKVKLCITIACCLITLLLLYRVIDGTHYCEGCQEWH